MFITVSFVGFLVDVWFIFSILPLTSIVSTDDVGVIVNMSGNTG